MKIYISITSLILVQGAYHKQYDPKITPKTIDEIIKKVNSEQVSWTAGKNFLKGDDKPEDFKWMTGTFLGPHDKFTDDEILPLKLASHFEDYTLPKSFDPATKWPECSHSLQLIRDQGNCGSCWAFGASEAMSDRVCIASKGKFHGDLSAEDILSCCGFICGSGCNGGWPKMAWNYFKRHGVVTGGLYGDEKSGCLPYLIKPCEHHTTGPRGPCEGDSHTPKCTKTCTKSSGLNWKSDKHYAVSSYRVENDEKTIMKEIFENGPVEAAIEVYEDFAAYKGGVYHHTTGKFLGGHAIRLVGWGETDQGEKYWVLANSWNTDWGENGYFRMRRGTNECGVESEIVAGIAEPTGWRRMFGNDDNRL